MQLYRLIYYSKSALHISGDIFAHHQEHLTVFTVSDSVHPSCCWLVSAAPWVNTTRYCKQSSAPDDGRKYRQKHAELTCNKKLTYIVASCWLFSQLYHDFIL